MMKETFKIAAVILILFAVVLGFIVIAGDSIGLDDDDARTLASILPGIGVIFVSFWGVTQASGMWVVGPIIGVGFGFVYVIYQMNAVNLMIPNLEMPVSEIQLVIIVAILIIAVWAAVTNR